MPKGILRRLLPSKPGPGAKNSRAVCPVHRVRFKSMGPGRHQCPECVRARAVADRQAERMAELERRREERDAQIERDRIERNRKPEREAVNVEGQE
jgi:hypothetical protein